MRDVDSAVARADAWGDRAASSAGGKYNATVLKFRHGRNRCAVHRVGTIRGVGAGSPGSIDKANGTLTNGDRRRASRAHHHATGVIRPHVPRGGQLSVDRRRSGRIVTVTHRSHTMTGNAGSAADAAHHGHGRGGDDDD
jgi:hypothetical protein